MSPKNNAFWKRIIETNPVRVVALLKILWRTPEKRGARTIFGDTAEDSLTALLVIHEAYLPKASAPWDGLVRHGFTRELCECFLRAPHGMNHRTPRDRVHEEQFRLLWTALFLWLAKAAITMTDKTPSSVDIFLCEIREYWSEIVQRIWDESQHLTYGQEKSHGERHNFVLLLKDMIRLDPSILKIIDTSSDLTIPLLGRYLCQSIGSFDFMDCVDNLRIIAFPEEPNELSMHVYRRDHPVPLDFFKRIECGAQPNPHPTDPHGPFSQLMSKIAGHTSVMSTPNLYITVTFLCDLVILADWNNTADREFLHSLFRCQELFSYLFHEILMVPNRLWQDEFAFELVLEVIPRLVELCADKALVADVEEREAFVRTCCKEDIFLAIEMVMFQMAEDFPAIYLYAIFPIIRFFDLLKTTPSLLRIIRPHFPRPHLLRLTLYMAFNSSYEIDSWLDKNPDATNIFRGAWQFVDALEQLLHVDKHCMRRGCKRRRTGRCKACGTVEYCNRECQTKDWSEHRMVCGFKDERSGQIDYALPPTRLPFRFGSY